MNFAAYASYKIYDFVYVHYFHKKKIFYAKNVIFLHVTITGVKCVYSLSSNGLIISTGVFIYQ